MENVVVEAAATLPYTVALHASTRILTFVLNSVLLRIVTHDVLGLANVRLQLLYTTVSFIAREPFRRALPAGEHVHESKNLNKRYCAIVRTNLLCPVLALTFGLPLTIVWLYALEEPPEEYASSYFVSTFLYVLSAGIETLAEPAHAAAMLGADFRLRMKAEGLGVGIRTVLTVVFVWYFETAKACTGCELYGFALAQFISSIIYAVWLWWAVSALMQRSSKEMKNTSESFFEPSYLRLSASFLAHSVVKQLLTEGERYIMTATGLLTFAQQGVYDVVNNLGSLVARLVFLPLEDTAYLVFSQMLDRTHKSTVNDLSSKTIVLVTRTLVSTLKTSLLVGFGCAVFGWLYSDIVLVTYAGESFVQDSDAIPLLRFFCLYTVFLAANGITESFVMAGMSQQDLDMHNLFDFGVSVVYTAAAVFLAKHFGSLGFIYANWINMFLRIGHSVHWIDHFYTKSNFTPLTSSIPSFYVIAWLAVSYVLGWGLQMVCPSTICRFCCGGVLGLVSLALFYVVEQSHFRFIYDMVARKKRSDDDTDNDADSDVQKNKDD